MYSILSRSKSVRYAALTAALLPVFLSGTANAVQQPEDELIQFAQPVPYMPYYHGEPEDGDVLFSRDGYDGLSSSSTVESLDEEAKRLDERIKEAKEAVVKAKSRRDQGEIEVAELRVTSLEKARTALRQTIERAKRLAPLQKKVDVKFENATVAQAAEALSRASGVQIKVDDTIPDTTRLTVEARKVRLVTVLESVARQAGLTIEPINLEKGDIGTELIAPPMLRVNDTVQRFAASPSPWSDKWGTPPTSRYIYTTGLPRVWNYTNGEGRTVTRAYIDGISAEAMGRSMAALGDLTARKGLEIARVAGQGRTMVVTDEKGTTIEVSKPGTVTVVERAKNDKNEDGYWRTVYTLKNGELTQQSRTWEKAKPKKSDDSGWLFKSSCVVESRV